MTDPMELVWRLEGEPGDCPFCGRDPYHYVDNGVGMERVAVTCCDEGIAYFQHGDPVLTEQMSLRREAAACIREMVEWRDIATAPKDGTVIVAWGKPCPSATEGPYVSRWAAYGQGSMARELWLRGEGPEGRFWHVEPVSNWTNSWEPTHWLPLPSAPNQAEEAGQ